MAANSTAPPGYLLGSIYFNYGVTAVLVVFIYFSLFFTNTLTGRQLLWVLTAFTLLFPLWFFRYGRALWIAFDERWDPWPNEEERRTRCPLQTISNRSLRIAGRHFAIGRLLFASFANREVGQAAKRADDHKGHRHHKQDAIKVARCTSDRDRIVT